MAYRNIIKMHTQKNKQVKYVNGSSCNFYSVARLLPEVARIRWCYFLDIATHNTTASQFLLKHICDNSQTQSQ